MENRTEFLTAIAAAIAEYRAAKIDVLESMRLGHIDDAAWIAQQMRLADAADAWGKIPRRFYG